MLLTPFKFETVQVNDRGEIIERFLCEVQTTVQLLENGIGLELVLIPGGIYQMGSPAQMGYADEHPLHPSYIPSFFMGKYLVNQAQWKAVVNKKIPFRREGDLFPADRISWKDATIFCQRLKEKSGLPFRLPSEAEWEYACRAGKATPFYFGPTLTTDLANYVGDHVYAGEAPGIYRHGISKGGSFPPNAFGLYDMHGNLWEWCADDWFDDYSSAGVDNRPRIIHNGKYKVVRGGSWHETPNNCRSAVRLKFEANEPDDYLGFRVALDLLK